MNLSIARAADVLLEGGLVTCPTEGVYGLSCMPDDPLAVLRLLDLKRRDASKGLILIAANSAQLDDWVDWQGAELPPPDPAFPITWIVKAAAQVSPLVRGAHSGLAVRLVTNVLARTLCETVDSPLISTSANFSGERVARNRFVLRRKFGRCVDFLVPGDCGPAAGPSEIRDLQTGTVLRPRAR
jgi:L-threonylcarbamoyladenylate synthase